MQTTSDFINVEIEIIEADIVKYLPQKATLGSSGYDLVSAEDVALEPYEFKTIRTGIKIAVPSGYEAQVRPRSGLASKYGLTVLNTPGTIDSDYRGEVCVILINLGKQKFNISKGMRIAQLVFTPIVNANFIISNLKQTQRGDGGFGSTGL